MENDFYPGWEDDFTRGYEMTGEEWEELHTPYDEKADWNSDIE